MWKFKNLTIMGLFLFTATANTAPLDDLLNQVKRSNNEETNIDMDALTRFKNDLKNQQSNLRKQRERNKVLQERMTTSQENIIQNNKKILAQQTRVNAEKADLDKVFDEFKRASQDLRGQLKSSPISATLVGRSAQLSPYSEANFDPDLPAIKTLWLLFTEQMVASSKITTAKQNVTMPNGDKATLMVTNIAGFSAFTPEGALLYKPTSETYQLLAPISSDIRNRINAFNHAEDGFISLLIDPSAGVLLERSTESKAWWQVITDAGVVGVIIIITGMLGISIALLRFILLSKEAKKITAQKQQLTQIGDNALGRIISVADQHINSNADELMRFLDEAILGEAPEFRKGLGTLAVLATVAPLLGLLGTVAGMIETFHAITTYGNSDPQVLSSGISQALLTTKFGLIAAVPLLLCHSFLSSKSDTILNIIEHQTAGLLAQRQQSLSNGEQ